MSHRPIEQIKSDISWKSRRLHDSQEHAQIVRYEAQIEELQKELKVAEAATQSLPTQPNEGMMNAIDLLGLETAGEYLKLNNYPELSRIITNATLLLRPVASGKSVIVPVEPTGEMIEAGWIGKAQVGPEDIYRAMISASNT